MTSSNDCDELIARFPRLFRGQGPQVPGYVGAGWHALVVRLFERIDALLGDEEAAGFDVLQIKQKFGGLRVYVSMAGRADVHVDVRGPAGLLRVQAGPSEGGVPAAFARVRSLIGQAAAEAAVTCEKCGAPGQLRNDGWMLTLCDFHDARRRLVRAGLDEPEDGA